MDSVSRQLAELEGRRRQLDTAGAAAGVEVAVAPAAAAGPAQLADLMHFMQQQQQQPAPQPMYSLAASGAAALPAAALHQPLPLQQEPGGYQPPVPRPDAGTQDEMDLSEGRCWHPPVSKK